MAPEFLYKDRPFTGECDIERARQIVCDNAIFFAPPCTFNDPFDSRPAFTFDAPLDEMKAYYRRLCRKKMPQKTEEQNEAELEKIFADPDTDLRTPQGQGVPWMRAPQARQLGEGTVRTWRTVTALLDLASQPAGHAVGSRA